MHVRGKSSQPSYRSTHGQPSHFCSGKQVRAASGPSDGFKHWLPRAQERRPMRGQERVDSGVQFGDLHRYAGARRAAGKGDA